MGQDISRKTVVGGETPSEDEEEEENIKSLKNADIVEKGVGLGKMIDVLQHEKEKYRTRNVSLELHVIFLKNEISNMNDKFRKYSLEKSKWLEEEKEKISLLEDMSEGEKEESVRAIDKKINAVKRSRIIKEFYDTEQTYIERLKVLRFDYLCELRSGKIVTKEEYKRIKIFLDIEEIFEINQTFLKELSQIVFMPEEDKDLFELVLEYCKRFQCYREYYKHFDESMKMIDHLTKTNKRFNRFLNVTCGELYERDLKYGDGKSGGSDCHLAGLLIGPVQRLPRYRDLMKRLSEYTPGNGSKGEEAIKSISETIDICEAAIEEYKTTLELEKLSYHLNMSLAQKVLILEKPVRIALPSGKKLSSTLYLFSDIFVIRENSDMSERENNSVSEGQKGGITSISNWSSRTLEKLFEPSTNQLMFNFLEGTTGTLRRIELHENEPSANELDDMMAERTEKRCSIVKLHIGGFEGELTLCFSSKNDVKEVVDRINEERWRYSLPSFKLYNEEEETEGEGEVCDTILMEEVVGGVGKMKKKKE